MQHGRGKLCSLPMSHLLHLHGHNTGPICMMARGGYFYSFPLTDGHSAYTKDFYLSNKESTSTLKVMETYQVWAERKTGKKLKSVRIDGRGEFMGEWDVWAECHSITLTQTEGYSSSSNGVAEHKHGITFSMVHAILHELGLPHLLWAHAAAYVVYTLNLLPFACSGFKIPAEIFLLKRQDVSHL